MEWDFTAGFWRSDPPHRFWKIGGREEIEVRGDELGVRIHPVRNNAPLLPPGQRPSGLAAEVGLDFRINQAGFNGPLEFLTGFTPNSERGTLTIFAVFWGASQ
jgi:hypothetical protein